MGYLDKYPLLLIFVASLILILLACEIGRWFGVRARGRGEERVATLEAAMFGLLSLMLGFTFAMALSRFEERRHAVLNDANAITTTELRLRLLPAPYDTESLKLLREYAQLRVTVSQNISTLQEIGTAAVRSNELQEQLWRNASVGAPKADISVPAWLVFESLNQMFDAHRTRLAMLSNEVPNEILLALYAITALTMAFAGYAQGLTKQPSRIPAYLMGALACTVIILIEDIETPYTGFISVSQQPLIDAAARLGD